MEKIRIICIEEWPAALCSFSSITRSKCESSRGCKESVHLNGCNANISTHLIKHHLLRESVSEKDPIFARAGLLEITEEQMQKMTVCPAHRHGLGKYWQAPKTCQYPRREGKKSEIFGTHVINFKTASEIKKILQAVFTKLEIRGEKRSL